jgi:hypothetical protein
MSSDATASSICAAELAPTSGAATTGVRAQPGKRDLGAGDTAGGGDFTDRVDDRVIAAGGPAGVKEAGERVGGGPGGSGGLPRPGEASAGER